MPEESLADTPTRATRKSFDLTAEAPAASRQLFPATLVAPSDPAEAAALIARLHEAWSHEHARAAELELKLAAAQDMQRESERVAEHALKLANGVIAAVRAVQRTDRPGSRAGSRKPSDAGMHAAAAAAAEAYFKSGVAPSSEGEADARCTRRVVGGVDVIQCAFGTCSYTCGTLRALERHRAAAHSLACAPVCCAPVPAFRPPPPYVPRRPPRAPSSGLGVADVPPDLSERFGLHAAEASPPPQLKRAASHAVAAVAKPPMQRALSVAGASGGGGGVSYAVPSAAWLRACGVANASRARATADSGAYVEFGQ